MKLNQLKRLFTGFFMSEKDKKFSSRRVINVLLASVLFILVVIAYAITAHYRHKENPKDKLVPTVGQIYDGFKRVAFEPDRKEEYRMVLDTVASGKRFFYSLALLSLAVLLGLYMGLFPIVNTIFYHFVLFIDKIPALALLPILFIVFGLGEVSKIALIVMGVFPTIVLDTTLRVKSLPRQQIIKARTLGSSNAQLAYRVVLPQILPAVLDTIRLNFKAMILFLIAGESLAATAGLGYRIFLVRRYIAMDIILTYVLWMSILAYSIDFLVRLWVKKRYTWNVVK
jgi:NitT/TauT family transport system permease protein